MNNLFILFCVALSSSLAPLYPMDYTSEYIDEPSPMEAPQYSILKCQEAWKHMFYGEYDKANEVLDHISTYIQEEVIHIQLCRLYMAIKMYDEETKNRILSEIDKEIVYSYVREDFCDD